MRLVGNDVVDLDDPAIAGSHRRARFVARVLTSAERERFDAAAAPQVYLWSAFAAKEAAYKALVKASPGVSSSPRAFEVAADLRSVRCGEARVELEVSVSGPVVHALAWLGGARPTWGVSPVGAGADSSEAVRAALLAELGDGGLTVSREPRPGSWDGFGPPRVLRSGAPTGLDISLAHDGRYVAWAWLATAAR